MFHDIMTWLIEHAACLLSFCERSAGGDNMIACYRLCGKHWHIQLLEFAKVVEFRRKGKATTLVG